MPVLVHRIGALDANMSFLTDDDDDDDDNVDVEHLVRVVSAVLFHHKVTLYTW